MSSNDYGNLGQKMKTMKDDRKKLVVDTEAQGRKRKAETKKFMGNVKAANADLMAQTHQTLAEADKMMAGIRKDLAAMKKDVGQTLVNADQFMAQTSAQTRQTLAKDGARIAADTEKFMAATRKANKVLKGQTQQILTEAAAMVKGLAQASCERAAAWQDVLRTVGGNGRGMPRRAAVAATRSATKSAGRPKANRSRAKTKSSGRSMRKTVSGSRSR